MTEMTDTVSRWDWGTAPNAETPHVYIMRGDEKFLSVTPCTETTAARVEEIVNILMASGYR